MGIPVSKKNDKIEVVRDEFPISKERTKKGTRRLAREKVLQVLAASANSDVSLDEIFQHVFFRDFTFDSGTPDDDSGRVLRPDEVFELEADTPILWTEEDTEYAVSVIRAAGRVRDESNSRIEAHSKNWDMERIALLDRVLINVAVAELTECSEIPVKVTINEVIELAKRYSTDKSGKFINGLLDTINSDLRKENRIKKTGRGLVE